jgi:Acyl carrier protein
VAINIEKEIISILSEISGVEEQDIKPETDLAKDLDIDSIKAIEITVAIEKKFKISVRDEDVPKIMTLLQAVGLVTTLLEQKRTANAGS